MNIHNPMHPGEFIRGAFLDPLGLTAKKLSDAMQVDSSTVSRVLSGKAAVTPEMAVRLSATLGRSAESWLILQANYDLAGAKKTVPVRNLVNLYAQEDQLALA